MKIVENGFMPDGTNIHIEDWSEKYKFHEYADTIACYPISKMSHAGTYAPKAGEKYRFSFKFDNTEDAKSAFDKLVKGETVLADFKDKMSGKVKYRNCI